MTTKYEAYFKRGGSRNVVFILLAFSTALLVALLALTYVLAPSAKAQAEDGPKAAGPVNPETGYPFWYQDNNGLRLGHCLDIPEECGVEGLPYPDQPMSFPDNWPVETFWWGAEAAAETPGGGQALLVLNTEGTFINEEVRDGDQATFGRIRVRVDDLDAGATYRVTHPYGVETFEDVAAGRRGINDSDDIGCLEPPADGSEFTCDFDLALNSRTFNNYLTWDTFGQSPENGGPPAGRVGNPLVNHAVTGSPETDAAGNPQNYFKVEKTHDADGTELAEPELHAETDQFAVMGKIAEQTAVATPRGGDFDAPQQVTLTGSEPSGDIFYTLDGSDPRDANNANRVQYDGTAIDIAETATLRYVVVNAEGQPSEIFEQRYVITLPTDVNLNAESATLDIGQSTSLSGQLTSGGDPVANQQVSLIQRTLGGENSFSPVEGGSFTTDAEGNFSLDGLAPEKNTIYRAVFGGEEEALDPSASAPVRVNVRAGITLNIGRDEIRAGQRVAMGGIVKPAKAGGEVELLIRQAGQTVTRESVSLDENSRYRYVFRAENPGNYVVRSIVRGDRENLGAISNVDKVRATR